ncbi:outer membrane protein with beta-barrel domain [Algoriphagus boseongensis]|uniref:Outer membrane protein with beta-barrel domain n=1 Tax=Algoriphagus boseongensis TaxID=1442587 RepID=A0A4R6T8D9_9BACT|nr:outer membrane beta-barrel protein [Algoriphagus boseongensis]TDQ18479.1 outer membrane protein with beta-barrel domain [Algoriphagus boseongensis]
MKLKLVFLSLLFFGSFSFLTQAQQGSGFGIKGGLNYNTSGKYFKDAENIFTKPGENMGYHFGVFYQLTSFDLALRPELIFTNTEFETTLGKVNYQKFDLPILVKMNFFKIISFQAGPSFHYTVKEKFSIPENFQPTDPFGLGFQLGLGVNIGPVGLDLRFERELNDRKFTFDNVLGKEDFKSQQLILGASFKIPGKKK